MISPIYAFLLSLQNCLGNCVSPKLRAVTFSVDKNKRGIYLCFFYDTEITEELEEEVSVLLLEANTYSNELEFRGYEVSRLDLSQQIPVQDGLAFLRYEKALPKFERKSHAFLLREKDCPPHAIYRLDMQQALLGRVTPALRHVGIDIDPDRKKLMAHFIYDGEITELDRRLAMAAIQDSCISFPDYEMESSIERVDYPNKMSHQGKLLAYWRKEWLFTDDGPVPAIRR